MKVGQMNATHFDSSGVCQLLLVYVLLHVSIQQLYFCIKTPQNQEVPYRLTIQNIAFGAWII